MTDRNTMPDFSVDAVFSAGRADGIALASHVIVRAMHWRQKAGDGDAVQMLADLLCGVGQFARGAKATGDAGDKPIDYDAARSDETGRWGVWGFETGSMRRLFCVLDDLDHLSAIRLRDEMRRAQERAQ